MANLNQYIGNHRVHVIPVSFRGTALVTIDINQSILELIVEVTDDNGVVIYDFDRLMAPYFDFSDGIGNKSVTANVIVSHDAVPVSTETITLYYSINEVTQQMVDEANERQASPEQPKQRRSVNEFRFIGKTGLVETVFFYGSKEREGDFSGTYLQVGDEYQKVHTDFNVNYRIHTGALTPVKRDLVYIMAESPNVWIIENGVRVPVTILDIDVSESEPHTTPIALAVTYRYSNVNKK